MCHLNTLGFKQNFNTSDDSQNDITNIYIILGHHCMRGTFPDSQFC